MITINFANSVAFSGNRPYADVILNPGSGRSPNYKCLVDTGADYLQLPLSAIAASGLNPALAVPHRITGASGAATFQRLNRVPVRIEGQPVTVDVLFDPTNKAPPLAGRNVLLAAFDLGMQSSTWHWD